MHPYGRALPNDHDHNLRLRGLLRRDVMRCNSFNVYRERCNSMRKWIFRWVYFIRTYAMGMCWFGLDTSLHDLYLRKHYDHHDDHGVGRGCRLRFPKRPKHDVCRSDVRRHRYDEEHRQQHLGRNRRADANRI